MRQARIKGSPEEGPGLHHGYSRVVNGAFLFHRREQEVIRKIIGQ